MAEVDERPRFRWGFLFVCGCAVLLIALLILGASALTVNRAIDVMTGPTPSKAARSEIAHADCTQLAKLYARYAPNGDSEEPDATGLRLTIDRQNKLGCEPGYGDPSEPPD